VVLAAVNSAQPTRTPDWYYNLKVTPLVSIDVIGRNFEARAEELSADRAQAFWPRVLEVAPGYADWKRVANRTIPLMRFVALERRAQDRIHSRCISKQGRKRITDRLTRRVRVRGSDLSAEQLSSRSIA
jgi:deazaflavin-dependent oxidoreductase (nitroreductase family)